MVIVSPHPANPSPIEPDDALPAAPWRRFVAIGDSFTEGLWDPSPTDPDACRGWADRLAEAFAARSTEPVHYANLAIRGKLLRPIIVDQVPAALELKPDLVSLIGGGNDLLRPNADPDRMARNIDDAVRRIRATGADVLLGTGMDSADSPLIRLTRGRVAVLNSHLWSIAQRRGAFMLDLWGMRALQDWNMWAEDRIHLTPQGHHRIAQGALVALGQEPDDPEWNTPAEELPTAARLMQIRQNAQWAREHVYPWAQRRIRRQSSGDNRNAKSSEMTQVLPTRP